MKPSKPTGMTEREELEWYREQDRRRKAASALSTRNYKKRLKAQELAWLRKKAS